MMACQVFGVIILSVIGLYVLYLVISTAVKDGINKSLVGQYIEKKSGAKVDKKMFLENDLDVDQS